jgi:hypothetical protein
LIKIQKKTKRLFLEVIPSDMFSNVLRRILHATAGAGSRNSCGIHAVVFRRKVHSTRISRQIEVIISPLEFSNDEKAMQESIESFKSGSVGPQFFLRDVVMYNWFVPEPARVQQQGATDILPVFSSLQKAGQFPPVASRPLSRVPGFAALWDLDSVNEVLLDPAADGSAAFRFPNSLVPLLKDWCEAVDTESVLAELAASGSAGDATAAAPMDPAVAQRLREVCFLLHLWAVLMSACFGQFSFFALSRESAPGQRELVALPRDFNAADPARHLPRSVCCVRG